MNGLLLKYFVLSPMGNSEYARASRAAMRVYADVIKAENSALATDLIAWVDRIELVTPDPQED